MRFSEVLMEYIMGIQEVTGERPDEIYLDKGLCRLLDVEVCTGDGNVVVFYGVKIIQVKERD